MAVLITPENKCVAEGRGEKRGEREKRENIKGNISIVVYPNQGHGHMQHLWTE